MSPYYDDYGNELNPDFVKMPSLCTVCKMQEDPEQEILCHLTRLDQSDEDSFECHAFVPLQGKNEIDEDKGIGF